MVILRMFLEALLILGTGTVLSIGGYVVGYRDGSVNYRNRRGP